MTRREMEIRRGKEEAARRAGLSPKEFEIIMYTGGYGLKWTKIEDMIVFILESKYLTEMVGNNLAHMATEISRRWGVNIGQPILSKDKTHVFFGFERTS